MVLKSDKIRLKKMLSDSITVLCRAGLPFQSKFQVEALIGITLDDSEVVLLSFKETSSSGLTLSSELVDDRDEEDDTDNKRNSPTDSELNFNPASITIKDEFEDIEWNAAGICKRPNRRRRSAQKFEDFKDSGEVMRASASSSINPNEQFVSTSTELDGQSTDLDYKHFDGNLMSNDQLDRNFSDESQKAYQAQMKIEADDTDDNADDCMIVKSEEPSLTECYEVGDNQSWDGQVFDGNSFQALQSVGAAGDMMPAVYPQDPSWLPQLSKPAAKKFKMPLQQRRQTWMARPSSTYTKSKNFQPAMKLHSKTTQHINNEAQENSLGKDVIGRPVMQCAYCNAVFNKSHVLKEHVNGVHFKKKLFHCPECGESFKWRAELSRHRRVPGMCPCSGITNPDWPGQN